MNTRIPSEQHPIKLSRRSRLRDRCRSTVPPREQRIGEERRHRFGHGRANRDNGCDWSVWRPVSAERHPSRNGSNDACALARAEVAAAATNAPSPLGTQAVPDALALLKALRHRWLLALSAGLVCAVAASTLTWFVLPTNLNMVTASALLFIKQADARAPLWTQREGVDWGTFKRTQCDLIKTRPVLEEALKNEQVVALGVSKMYNSLDWLESKIKVDGRDNSEVVEISMTGEKPAQITILVNAVVDAYLAKYVKSEIEHKQDVLLEYKTFQTKLGEEIKQQYRQVLTQKRFSGDQLQDVNQMIELTNFQRARPTT